MQDYISRRKAAETLKVSPRTVDKICCLNGIRTLRIPGHSRKLYFKQDVLELIAKATAGGRA